MKTVRRVEKLTPEQEAAMPGYSKKWIEIGLRTGETDWDTFDKYMPVCYEKAGLKYPKNVVRVSSPLVGALASAIAEAILRKRGKGGAVRDAVDVAVRDAVDVAVRDAVDGAVCGAVDGAVGGAVDGAVGGAVDVAVCGAVRGAVDGAVRDAVDGAVCGAVRDAVDGAVGGAVCGAVDGAVDGAVRGAVKEAVFLINKNGIKIEWHYWLGGQFWVGYGYCGWRGVAFCNFFFDVCGLVLDKDTMERANAYRKVSESVNYIWPNKDFVMVCSRPTKINRNSEGRLHCENGMAIQYPDGWGLWYLNGIKVPEWLVTTPESKLTMEQFNSLENADVRAEFIRKFGIERMAKLGKPMDSHKKYSNVWWTLSEYELLDMAAIFKNVPKAPFLRMKNQTTGTWHMEGVHPNCKTIGDAMKFRCGEEVEIVNIK